MSDPHDLQRFVDAQAPVMAQVDAELNAGAKTSHWMWFVFPQLKALGRSDMARRYGIASRQEAAAYWAHPVLGPRLKRSVQRVLAVPHKSAHEIFGSPDDLKFCSCLTLFETVAPGEPVWSMALDRWYGGLRDLRTQALLDDEPA
ncbi:DUF1810 domain-containing protein [Piscinibacter sp. HJYY11]|uniref:DUF1810 domain-containing protein n=1 Tax=Piscinibacter sp. HJYY11 TaxID=2801333 RepID=UPI00191F58F1|nr:DUF1810 domain-containing protein [Piscinibacter sp. HJYY11]MBL0728548.1 DUF1810 domain-containing protein [Piscinibacter sp. HJYY11]